jgi:hypothetical protein
MNSTNFCYLSSGISLEGLIKEIVFLKFLLLKRLIIMAFINPSPL